MDVQALASTPIFAGSLAICALLAAYSFALLLRFVFGGASRAVASAGVRPYELEAVQYAGVFHNQVETLIQSLVALEDLASELPHPFSEQTWSRLVELCDDLETVRARLNVSLGDRDFSTAFVLGEFLSGASPTVPDIPTSSLGFELRKLALWQLQSKDLLQRMVIKIEDSVRYGIGSDQVSVSPQFRKTLHKMKELLVQDRLFENLPFEP